MSTIFTMTTADIRQAAIIQAAGIQVDPIKKPASPRCIFQFEDSIISRALLENYERRKALSIPPKSIMEAYTNLLSVCKTLQAGRIGGGV